MKKLFLLFCFFFFTNLVGYTQTSTGNLLIGGHIGWNAYRNDGTFIQPYLTIRQDQFMFTGDFGTFLQDDLAVGLLYRQEFNTSTQEDHTQMPVITTISNSNSITIGPFIRRYFVLGGRFSFYTQAMLGYMFNSNKSKQNNSEPNSYSYRHLVTNLQPGLAFFASNKIGIDLTVPGLEYRLRKAENRFTGHEFSAKFNLPALNLGLSFYLNR